MRIAVHAGRAVPSVTVMRTTTRWITVGILALALAGCSADRSGNDAATRAEMDSGGVDEGAPAAAPEDAGGAQEGTDASAGFGEGLNLADQGRSVITTGGVTLSAEDPVAAAAEISDMVDRLGGWVEGESLQAGSETVEARARLVVRIPSQDVGTALSRLTDVGKVENVELERSDVTLQVRDLEARIRAVEMSVDRMEALLAQANTADDLVRAEQMLTERQSQLEQLLSQQAVLDDQVSMSTLTVEIVVPEEVPPPPPPPVEPRTGFLGGLQNGWESFLAFGEGALLVLGALLPWLAFAAILTAVVMLVRRAYLRARPERPARPPRPTAPPAALPPMGYPAPPGAPMPPPGWVQPGQPQQPVQPQAPTAAQTAAQTAAPATAPATAPAAPAGKKPNRTNEG